MTLILPSGTAEYAFATAYSKGNAAFNAGDWNAAITHYSDALNCRPDANVFCNLGFIYQTNWQLGQARKMYEQALALDPWHIQALGNLANVQQDMLEPEAGFELKRQAVALVHQSRDRAATLQAHAELVFTSTTLLRFGQMAAEMRDFCRQRLAGFYPDTPWIVPMPEPGRKIRLGYISADFNRHTVMTLLEPLFANFDRDRYDLTLYSNGEKPDGRTEELKEVGQFRDISKRSDRQVQALMKRDKLDLLVDLSGYSSGHRLSLLARKPAPRIATGLGFITPIGCPSVDYALLDQAMVSDEQAAAGLVPEQIVRIPSNMYYRPEPVLELETPERDQVVFGSANSLFKINGPVIQTWAAILRLVPNSVLALKSKALTDPSVLDTVHRRFAEYGIDPARITGSGQAPRGEFMRWYHGVDICLDPFPYQGGVTSSEAIYMGCPMIACDAGGINTTVSILRAADMAEYVADSPEDYVRLAVELGMLIGALDPAKRRVLREHFRAQIMGSIIFDADHFARQMEQSYEWMVAQPPRFVPRGEEKR